MMQITELDVWRSSMDLTQELYELAEGFGKDDKHGLSLQIRDTAIEIPSNIASAASKKYGRDSLRYLYESKSAIYKIETQIYLAHRLEYLTEERFNEMIEKIDTCRRLLFGFIKHYKRSSH